MDYNKPPAAEKWILIKHNCMKRIFYGGAMLRSQSIVLLIFPASVIMFSCEGPQGPAGPIGDMQIWVTAEIGRIDYWDADHSAAVIIENCPVIPTVKINDTFLNHIPDSWTGGDYSGIGNLTFEVDSLNMQFGDSAALSIEFIDEGGVERNISGSAILPGEFHIIEPPDSSIDLVWGEDLTFIWSNSEHASGYRVDFSRNVSYITPGGEPVNFNYYVNTVISDTSITFPAQFLNPDSSLIGYVNSTGGTFRVSAFNGPADTGEQLNLEGDGQGYFYGYTFGGRIFIDWWW